jgi:lipopolysaccharide/colanic/teichoic acid biosynthesis glycosyltransferase
MNNILKRIIDILGAFSGLVLMLPLMVLIAIYIKIDSQGPVLFKQERLSINGKTFMMLKFRTMVVDAEKKGSGLFNFKNDSRVTRAGEILRKSSLDELPQLINVLIGSMSLVGPRPCVVNELGAYSDLNDRYRKRFTMKPGITGLAQIKGRNEISWSNKIIFDNEYIDLFKKYGILIDIKILFLTLFKLTKSVEIYEQKRAEYSGLTDEEISLLESKRIIEEATSKEGN